MIGNLKSRAIHLSRRNNATLDYKTKTKIIGIE